MPPLPPGAKVFLLVTDNRRSRPDSPFCVITLHRKFEFGHHRQSKKISNAQELTMQLSQALSATISQIKVSNSPITNHTKKDLAPAPSSFFQFLYITKDKFLVDCFNGGRTFRLFFFFFFFFSFGCCWCWRKNDVLSLKGWSSPGKFWKI